MAIILLCFLICSGIDGELASAVAAAGCTFVVAVLLTLSFDVVIGIGSIEGELASAVAAAGFGCVANLVVECGHWCWC